MARGFCCYTGNSTSVLVAYLAAYLAHNSWLSKPSVVSRKFVDKSPTIRFQEKLIGLSA